MFDVKPIVNSLLETLPGVTISDTYPKNFNCLPHISFYEIGNMDALGLSTEYLSDISIQIDIWHNRSTGALAEEVEQKMRTIGFVRKFMADIPDPSGIKHKTIRYRGVIDKRTHMVHQ